MIRTELGREQNARSELVVVVLVALLIPLLLFENKLCTTFHFEDFARVRGSVQSVALVAAPTPVPTFKR